jgi:hypothetical protein
MSAARWVALGAGLVFVVAGLLLGRGPYEDRRAFERAGYCAEPRFGGVGCVLRMPMTVLSRSTYTTEDPDPNWPPQPPPQPPPPPPPIPGPFRIAPGVLPMSTTTHYKVTIRTQDGRRHTYEVNPGLYDAARPGVAGVADVWRGRVVRLRVGAHSDDEWSYWSLGGAWVLGWLGLMLVVGWGLPLADPPVAFVIGGWGAGVVLFAVLHTWHPAPWFVPVLFAGSLLVVRATMTVAGPRHRW